MKIKAHPFAKFFGTRLMDAANGDGGDGGGAPEGGQGGGEETPPEGGSGDGGDSGGEPSGDAKPTDFLNSFEPDVREKLEANGIKDAESLVKNWQDAQSYMGQSIRVPSEEAGKEDWSKFYDKLQKHAPNLIPRPDKDNPESMQAVLAALGRPEDENGYEAPEVPEGVNIPEDRIEAFKKLAYEAGLSKDQFQGVLGKVLELDAQQATKYQEAAKAEHEELKKEWGSAYDERSGQVTKMLELTNAPTGVVEMAKNGQLGADTLKWMHSISQNFKGEGMNLTNDEGGSSKMTPSEANERLNEIYANKDHPFFNPSHPDHKRSKDKVVELMSFANPESSKNANDLRSSFDADFGG